MAIEIVDLPINSMVIFHSFLYVYQRVYIYIYIVIPIINHRLTIHKPSKKYLEFSKKTIQEGHQKFDSATGTRILQGIQGLDWEILWFFMEILMGKSSYNIIYNIYIYGDGSKPCTPVVHIKIAGKWMFIPLNMVLIGIDP